MNTLYKSDNLFIKSLNFISVLYIVSLFTVTSNDSLYGINRILFFILVISFLVFLLLFRSTIKIESILLVTLPIFIVIIVSNVWAIDSTVSLNRTIGIMFYYVGAIIIYLLVHNGVISINRIMVALLFSVIILSVSASYDYYFSNIGRGSGLAGNPNTFGLNVVFLCPLIWAINKLRPNHESAIVRWICYVALLNASIVSGGRKVLIASIIILFFFYVFSGRSFDMGLSHLKIAIIFCVLSLLILLFVFNLDNITSASEEVVAINRLLDDEDASSSIRTEMIDIAIQLFKENPVIGYGIDNYSVISIYGTYSHNNYTELLVSMGVIGFVLYYYMYTRIILYSARKSKELNNQGLLRFTLFYFLLILVLEVALVNLYRPTIWLLLILIILINKNAIRSNIVTNEEVSIASR